MKFPGQRLAEWRQPRPAIPGRCLAPCRQTTGTGTGDHRVETPGSGSTVAPCASGMTCVTAPPVAEIRARPFPGSENRTTPSAFQLPPRPKATGASVSGAPPPTSSRLSALPVKNPIDRLSGDQKGCEPPSVPGRTCAVVAARRAATGGTHHCSISTMTICLPSGESAIAPASTTWVWRTDLGARFQRGRQSQVLQRGDGQGDRQPGSCCGESD